MKYIFVLSLLFLAANCSKPKSVLICGNHVCINKAEAKQYFEDNLTIEVKILDNKSKKNIDLIELNLNKDESGKKQVRLISKKKTNKKIKILNNEEIDKIKANIKNKKKKRKIIKNDANKKEKITNKKISKKIKKKQKENKLTFNIENKKRAEIADVCTLIDKCNIDEISKFLIKQGNKKNFPNISKNRK